METVDTQDLPKMQKISPYAEWQAGEGIPIYDTFFVQDMKRLELKRWARLGADAAFINLEGAGESNNCYVAEIAPGARTTPMRHMYEELVYVLQGSGATTVWHGENTKHSFEWQAGSLFSIPLNANFQHFNTSGKEPARYVAVITAPVTINLFHNTHFVFNNPYDFTDRFDGEGKFDGSGKLWQQYRGRFKIWETNFVPSADTHELYRRNNRGAGGSYLCFELAHGTMVAHISEFPVGTYKKAHRHGAGANVIILSGQGFTLLWEDGKWDQRVKVDWKPGSIVVPPSQWFHQHFNSGPEPARYLALRWGSNRYSFRPDGPTAEGGTDTSVKDGGDQIEYADEHPEVHRLFESELQKTGAVCHMKQLVKVCSGVGHED